MRRIRRGNDEVEHCWKNQKVLKISRFSCAESHQDHSKVNSYEGSPNMVWVSDEMRGKRGRRPNEG